MIRCDTCPATLTPADRRGGRRRCRACCKAMPRILTERPVRKGHTHISAEWQRPVGKAAKAKPVPGVSWWLSEPFQSDRTAFAARAEALVPRQTNLAQK